MTNFYELAEILLQDQDSVELNSADGTLKLLISRKKLWSRQRMERRRKTEADYRTITIEVRRYTTYEKDQWLAMVVCARNTGKFQIEFYFRVISVTGQDEPTDFSAHKLSRTRTEEIWLKQCLTDPTLQVVYRGPGMQILQITDRPEDFGSMTDN